MFRKELFMLLWLLYNRCCSTQSFFLLSDFTSILPLSSSCYYVMEWLTCLVLSLHRSRPFTDLLNSSLSWTLWLTDWLMAKGMSGQLSRHLLLLLQLFQIWTVDDEEVINVIVIDLPNPWYWVISYLLWARAWAWCGLGRTYRTWSTLVGVLSVWRCTDSWFRLVHVRRCWLSFSIKLLNSGIFMNHSLVLGWLWIAFLRSHTQFIVENLFFLFFIC